MPPAPAGGTEAGEERLEQEGWSMPAIVPIHLFEVHSCWTVSAGLEGNTMLVLINVQFIKKNREQETWKNKTAVFFSCNSFRIF